MASVFPGFEYDIFISYRHNDNRSGWVTEFVSALQEELAATLKDPVNIYFDKNPHDGLLEMHNVDKSLEAKLNCIIFIPVISQTYSDPKSFAWQHEFCAFNRLAKEQSIPRDIKLGNGNVTSRILPVKIHDLDEGDKALIESEIGGILRSIEFIYKSSGVNRPLRVTEEQPEGNLNHTTYRNQINKLANAIKQIITALPKASGQANSTVSREIPGEPTREGGKSNTQRTRKIVGALVLTVAIATALFFFLTRTTSGSVPDKYDYDVAVMYLENFTDNTKYGDQLASLVHINLTGDTSLHVLPRQKLYDEMKEATGEAVAPDRFHTTDIAKRIGTRTILTGSIHQQGETVLVQLELTDVASGKILKTEKLEGPMDQIFALSDKICKNMMASSLKQEFNVTLLTTGNYEAFQKFHDGLNDFYAFKFGAASEKFGEAVAIDSTFALGYLLLAQTQDIFGFMNVDTDLREPIKLIEKAMMYSYKLSSRDKKLVDAYYKMYKGDMESAQRMAIENYDSIADDRFYFIPVVWTGFTLGGKAYITTSENYLKRNPSDGIVNNQLAYLYALQGNESLTEKYINRYLTVEPNTLNVFDSGFETYMTLGKRQVALKYLNQWEQLAGRPAYGKRARYFLTAGKGEDLRNFYRLYSDARSQTASFQEMLPFSFGLEGKFKQALAEFDKIISRFEKKNQWREALMLRMHKAILIAASGRMDEAINACDDVVARTHDKLKENYNPHLFLSNYYAGLIELRRGDLGRAKGRLGILKDLRTQQIFDWRFEVYVKLLEAEILTNENRFDGAKAVLGTLQPGNQSFSVGAMTATYKLAWRTADYKDALKQIEPFDKNFLRSSADGGDAAHFTWERIYSDYTTARIYQDAGNKQEAIRYYNTFIEQLRGSDTGIKEKDDAISRLKSLTQ
jgi:TolB-like protein